MEKTSDLHYKRIGWWIWLSFTLSVLFFHPLISTLNDNIVILQWRMQNTLELVGTLVVLTACLTLVLVLSERFLGQVLRLIVLMVITVLPLLSFLTFFVRQLGFKKELIRIGQVVTAHKAVFISLFILGGLFLLWMMFRAPSRLLKANMVLLLVLSPVNLAAVWTLFKIAGTDTVVQIQSKTSVPDSKVQAVIKPRIIVLMFDELSYEMLYTERAVDARYSNIREFSLISSNYHAATAPGKQTVQSLPGFLAGERFDRVKMLYESVYSISRGPEGDKKEVLNLTGNTVFSQARRKGMRTVFYAPYLPYCELCGPDLDECRTFSIYNFGTVVDRFSFFNPFRTTFNLWPHQFPLGMVKNRIYSVMQRKMAEQTIQLTMESLDDPGPTFLFSHFYFTHTPYVFSKEGYYQNPNPFRESAENYRRSLDYADLVFGRVISRLRENGVFDASLIILLSDHNYRVRFPQNKSGIPMMIKRAGQSERKDVDCDVKAELIFREEIERFNPGM